MAEKEASGQELAKLYQGGATLAKTGAETGLGRFAVAYRLKKDGVARRNRGSPRKTTAEKGAFARHQLETIFGESLSQAIADLQAGVVTAKELAEKNEVKPSTLLTQFRRAGTEVPHKGGKHKLKIAPRAASEAEKEVTILDLVDARDWRIADRIISRISDLGLSVPKVAVGSDEDLEILGFTKKEISYMRRQLEKNGFSS